MKKSFIGHVWFISIYYKFKVWTAPFMHLSSFSVSQDLNHSNHICSLRCVCPSGLCELKNTNNIERAQQFILVQVIGPYV